MLTKIDLKKELKHLYAPSSRRVAIVDVPAFNFIMIDGRMQPGETPETSQSFHDAMMALYGVSFTLKFMSKLRKHDPIDYTVMAVEGLWWTDVGKFDINQKDQWRWTLMMMQPEHIPASMFYEAVDEFRQKRDSAALPLLRFEQFREGRCMQIMHIGPYSAEVQTIARMHAFAQEHGYRLRGKHHEIYLGDPRRAKPEKLKTVLRQPIEKIA